MVTSNPRYSLEKVSRYWVIIDSMKPDSGQGLNGWRKDDEPYYKSRKNGLARVAKLNQEPTQ